MKTAFFKKFFGCITAVAMVCSFLTAVPTDIYYSVNADSDILINETNFPDQYFRNYIKQFDKDENNIFSQSEISCVQNIDVAFFEGDGLEYLKDHKNIKSLQGVEFFTSLVYLHCGYLDITSLDLTNNTKLQRLECESCKLPSLDLTKNTELVELHCNDNNFTSLDLSKNTKLIEVDCSNNKITDLKVNNSPELGVLRFANNKVTSINISNDVKLKELCCSNNLLRSLNLSKNTDLIRLECSENQLTSLDLSNIKGFDGSTESIIYDIWYPVYSDPCNIGTEVEPGFVCDNNIYKINVSSNDNSYNLSGLPAGFNSNNVISCSGASLNGNSLTDITGVNGQDKITYTYNCGKDKSALFTLAYGENITEEDNNGAGILICKAGEELTVDYTSGRVESSSGTVCYMKKTGNYTGNGDIENLKWVLYTTADKASSNAKFGSIDKKGKKVYNLASVTGTDEVTIGGLKANGQFNNTVVLKAVSKDYNPAKNIGYVYAECTLYINPAEVTKFKEIKDNAKTPGFIFKNDKTGVSLTQVTNNTCTLTLPEGASYKLPFTAENGVNKTLSYTTDSSDFTVLNGTVKGLSAGTGTIIIKPVYGICSYTVNVEITGKISKIRSNVTSVTLFPNSEQIFTVSPSNTSNLSETLKVSFSKDAEAYSVETSTDNGKNWSALSGSGVQAAGPVMFKIRLAPGNSVISSEKLTITSDKTSAKLNIPVKYAAAPQNIKSFTEKTELKKNAKYRVVNIPVNSYYNLNCSVNPANADNRFTFKEVDPDGNTTAASNNISINGDVIKGLAPGTVYIQAVSEGINANNEKVRSSIYQINIYKPSSSIVWKDTEYCVKGDHLMLKETAETTSDKNITGGQYLHIAIPETKGTEHITWTSNREDAVNIAEICDNDDNWFLEIGLFKPGTYTVTGVTEFTKQRFTFKILVTQRENPGAKIKGVHYKRKDDTNYSYLNTNCLSNYIEMEVGSTMQLIPEVSETCVNMSFSSDNKAVTVNKNGLVKAVKFTDDQVNITADIGNTKVTVKIKTKAAVTAAPKITLPEYAAAGKAFSVSTNLKNAKWYYRTGDSDSIKELSVIKNKVSDGLGKGIYYIFPSAAEGIEKISQDYKYAKEIRIYDPIAASVKVLEPSAIITDSNGTYSRNENIPEEFTLKNMSNSKKGVVCGTRFIIPVSAFDSNSANKQKAEKDDIIWTTSNANLAVVKPVSEYPGLTEKTDGDTYAEYAVELNSNGYTGKVTLTGMLKNSGKKVNITVFVTQ